MFDFKTLLETLWPTDIDSEGDLSKLLDGLAEDYQEVYDQIQLVAHIRNPRRTGNLSDLEREYGIVPDNLLSDQIRRQMLAHVMYQRPTTASWEHLQNALEEAGFNLIVTQNNPVVDPADVTIDISELLVNGKLYTSQEPAYYMAAGSDIAYAGHSRGYSGYYIVFIKTLKTYSIPTNIKEHWTWRFVFWVGGAASSWSSSPAIAVEYVDKQRATQLKNLILKYKPAFTWCVLCVDYPDFLTGTGNHCKVLRSDDQGLTWDDYGQLGSELYLYSLAHLGNGICLAGTSQNGHIYRSTDFGENWTDLGQQQSAHTVQAILHLGNGIVLASLYITTPSTIGKIIRSEDFGQTWEDIGDIIDEEIFYSLIHLGDGIILAGAWSSGKIYRSTDYGESWTDLGQQGSEDDIYCFTNVGKGIILAGSEPGGLVFRSADYGLTWDSGQQLGTETSVYSLLSLGNGIILAGTDPLGKIFRSTDYGVTWTDLGRLNPADTTRVYSLASIENGRICVAGTHNNARIFRSTDYGQTWTDLGQQASELREMCLIAL